MNPVLQQFLADSRELAQGIALRLLRVEKAPDDREGIEELFQHMHTLHGMSRLVHFPRMTRILRAGEDLLSLVRKGDLAYSSELATRLLGAIECVLALCSDIETTEEIETSRNEEALHMAGMLRAMMPVVVRRQAKQALAFPECCGLETPQASPGCAPAQPDLAALLAVPEATRREAWLLSRDGEPIHWIDFQPLSQCFIHGDDPFYAVRQTPGLLWGNARSTEAPAPLAELDICRCVLAFHLLASASAEVLANHFCSMAGQSIVIPVQPSWLGSFADPPELPLLPPAACATSDLPTPAPQEQTAIEPPANDISNMPGRRSTMDQWRRIKEEP
jgi:two-component system chemotaxis sensor kinase CheA